MIKETKLTNDLITTEALDDNGQSYIIKHSINGSLVDVDAFFTSTDPMKENLIMQHQSFVKMISKVSKALNTEVLV